jgi:hypothetical protein
MAEDLELLHLNKVINETPKEKISELEVYLSKFLPSNEPIKDECCLKYLVRPSGRYCHNCPHHPLRGSNDVLNKFVIATGRKMLNEKNYTEFIALLKKYNLPYPVIEEINELMVQ